MRPALDRAVVRTAPSMSAPNLSITLWALATLGWHAGEGLMRSALEEALVRVAPSMNAPDVVNALWALATVDSGERWWKAEKGPMRSALQAAAVRLVPSMNSRELETTLTALAALGWGRVRTERASWWERCGCGGAAWFGAMLLVLLCIGAALIWVGLHPPWMYIRADNLIRVIHAKNQAYRNPPPNTRARARTHAHIGRAWHAAGVKGSRCTEGNTLESISAVGGMALCEDMCKARGECASYVYVSTCAEPGQADVPSP